MAKKGENERYHRKSKERKINITKSLIGEETDHKQNEKKQKQTKK